MFFERETGGERAIICSVAIREPYYLPDADEFFSLVTSAGAEIAGTLTAQRQRPSPTNYIGVGKVEELATLVRATEADLVIFDGNLSPSQERNLERQVKARVIDRSGLILDIFASRARTFEGKLQVELAQLVRDVSCIHSQLCRLGRLRQRWPRRLRRRRAHEAGDPALVSGHPLACLLYTSPSPRD